MPSWLVSPELFISFPSICQYCLHSLPFPITNASTAKDYKASHSTRKSVFVVIYTHIMLVSQNFWVNLWHACAYEQLAIKFSTVVLFSCSVIMEWVSCNSVLLNIFNRLTLIGTNPQPSTSQSESLVQKHYLKSRTWFEIPASKCSTKVHAIPAICNNMVPINKWSNNYYSGWLCYRN